MNTKRKRSTKGTNLFDGTIEVEPRGEPVVGAALLDELALMVSRYVVLPAACPEALALWVLHTYAFELRDITTYLGLESPEKRCGKTTLLEVLCELVNRPVVAANISSSAFFRVIEEVRPTLLIDEVDTFLQGNEELRGILNSGYSRKTAFVVRVASQEADLAGQKPEESTSRLVKFSCWCPKVAQRLRPYGVRPRTIWVDGVSAKGYDRADFEEVFPRYIPRAEWEAFKADTERRRAEG